MTISCEAYAKVNLYLHVCGRRENGYHELDSLIVFASTGDVVHVEAADILSLDVVGPMARFIDGDAGDNLVMQAAKGLQALYHVKTGAKITLDKRLPVAAGIGGGSGDAAATLKALCELWKIKPEPEELHSLALSLGADVPICMEGVAAHVSGVGEVIEKVGQVPSCWMMLVNPMVAVSTPAIFKARTGAFTPATPLTEITTLSDLIEGLQVRKNDLTGPAIELAPEVRDVLDAISEQKDCLLSRMSGSGATCFGLFETEKAAQAAKKQLQKAQKSWWFSVGKII